MTTRIDRRFAALRAEGRAALVTFVMAGDPDLATSLAIVKALPKAGADVIEIGMPFTDPMADGPAIQAAGLRALRGGQTLRKTLALARAFRETDADTPIVLMGYYNPIYVYGVEAFLRDAKARRRRRPDRRRSAAGGGRGTVPAGAEGRAQFHPPGDADDRRQAPAGRARQHVGLRLLRFDHRRDRRGGGRPGQDRRRGCADQASYPSAGGGRLRRQGRGERGRDRRASPTASSSARRWSRRCAVRWSTARPGRTTVDAVAGLARTIAEACAAPPRRDAADGGSPMNWISNVVPPKIRSLLRRETPENLWVKCPESGQLVFHKDLEANLMVVPGSGYHMAIERQGAAGGAVRRRRAMKNWRCPRRLTDPLKFRDIKRYADRLKEHRAKTGSARSRSSSRVGAIEGHGDDGRRCTTSPSRAARSASRRAKRSSTA